MKKAVFFDLDGTLADTLESIAQAGNKALSAVGCPAIPMDLYRYLTGDGADTLIRRMLSLSGVDEDSLFEKTYQEYKEFFQEDCTYHVKPYDGIRELLDALKQRNILIGVISNKPHHRSVQVVENLFGTGYFDIICGHKEGVPKKPNPKATISAAKELNVLPEECIYVGDTDVDMKNGKAASMFTVGVLWGFRDYKELLDHHADRIIDHPTKLLEYL